MKLSRSITLSIAGLATMAMLSGCGDTAQLTGPGPELDTTPPPAPQNLGVVGDASGRPMLIWTESAAPDVAGYQVYVYSALPGGGHDYVLADPAISTDASFHLPSVTESVEASYRVRAVDAAGNWSGFSATADVVIPAPGELYETQ